MSLSDAFAPAEADYRARVMAATWGHLYPEPGHKYQGKIVFAIAGYGGDCVIMSSDWGTLADSPVLYQTMMEVFDKTALKSRSKHAIMGSLRYGLFEWTGTMTVCKNGATRLSKGKIKTIWEAK